MIIEQLELLNWGPWSGSQTIEFTQPSGQRRIEHIRGRNGHGKTHLLNALKIGLHGAAAMKYIDEENRRVKASDEQHLAAFLHSTLTHGASGGEGPHIRLGLKLSEEVGGASRTIKITRTWWLDSDDSERAEGELHVEITGGPEEAETLSGSDAEEYVTSIIPADILQFFFFDGERVQSIAESDPRSGSAVASALDDLLGFTTLDKLKSDLDQARTALGQSQNRSKAAQAAVKQLEGTIAGIDAEITEKDNEIHRDRVDLAQVEKELESVRRQLPAGIDSGADGGGSRTEIMEEINASNDQLERQRRNVASVIGRDLPFVVPVGLVGDTVSRLDAETILKDWERRRSSGNPEVEQLAEAVLGESAPQPEPALTAGQRSYLFRRLREAWADLVEPRPESLPTDEWFAAFTEDELRRAADLLGNPARDSLSGLSSDLKDVDVIQRRIQQLRDKAEGLEDQRERQRLLKELEEVSKRHGAADERLQEHLRELAELQDQRASEHRKLQDVLRETSGDDKIDRQIDVINRLTRTIEQFQEQMRRTRVSELESRIQEMLEQLAHKGSDQFSRCEIDERTFALRIYDEHGVEVQNLSAGEKELLALSMIWALGRISRRRLPLVIDTPLGRLDVQHSTAVVERFLPQAAEQVVVLSQESEITDEYRDLLSPYLTSEQQINWEGRQGLSSMVPLAPVTGGSAT